MKGLLLRLFLWSWVATLPVTLVGGYWVYRSMDRFYTYKARYDPVNRNETDLGVIGKYEIARLVQRVRAATVGKFTQRGTSLKVIYLFVPESNLATLESHMPQSGFNYVKARMLIDGKLEKVKVKYRGDTFYRWVWDKKSIRIKTTTSQLADGLQYINLLSPRTAEQLNNYLSYRLAAIMGLLAPRTELVRLFVNGEDKGVFIMAEQIKEITLRNHGVMPGDIYRGEINGKDGFQGSGINSLFDTSAVWDKVAVNNHYDEASMAPLATLIDLIHDRDSPAAQSALSGIMDMDAWGRYSAYETLTQSAHADEVHNWRLYYDPWREKFFPIIWDTMGWHDPLRKVRYRPQIIASSLMQALFGNGDFIRARSRALDEFFNSGKDQLFLRIVSESIDMMEREIGSDPILYPASPATVNQHMRRLERAVANVFSKKGYFVENGNTTNLDYAHYVLNNKDLKRAWKKSGDAIDVWGTHHWRTSGKNENRAVVPRETPLAAYKYSEHILELSVSGKYPLSSLRLEYDGAPNLAPRVDVNFSAATGRQSVNISGAVRINGNLLYLDAGLLPNVTVVPGPGKWSHLAGTPGYYRIRFTGLDQNLQLTDIALRRGDRWLPVESVAELEPTTFGNLYAPVAAQPLRSQQIWSGEVKVAGHQTLVDPLLIKPGTTVRLAPGATLILKGRLLAEGTTERPIRFLPEQAGQAPWGAVVLSGRGADGSRMAHCEVAGGSGQKGDLFEYSAMFSVHEVKDVSVKDCLFRDNRLVDDMMHTVYSDIHLERVTFRNAFSDALDLDISQAELVDSLFVGSGNDAVDLMT
ncbi:MAG: CotH kinase family protein, partial [Arenicellales bacterium]|nr:CotH kinase family protein [Arenicellales bacterium]